MPVSRIWELLAKKYNHELNENELRELETLLTQHHDAFQLDEIISGLDRIPLQKVTDAADEHKSLMTIKLAMEKGREEHSEENLYTMQAERMLRKRRILQAGSWLSGVAACLVFAWFWWPASKQMDEKDTPKSEVVTNGNSKSTINLPDGSVVKLNANSSLWYNEGFGVNGREITLVGEAFFEIAKNEDLPLTVHAGNMDIIVKGTVFNVRAYKEDATVEASLIEGSIEVSDKNDPDRKILLRPNEKILIAQAMVNPAADAKAPVNEGILEMAKIKPNPTDSSINEIAWIEDKLTFYREPFYSLAQKMERWYNVTIQFETEQMRNMTFTGSFEKENITEALDALRQLASFNYTIENRKVTITNTR